MDKAAILAVSVVMSAIFAVSISALADSSSTTTVSPTDAGTAAANSTLQLYGTQNGLQSNISQPMTNSSTPLTTVDGSQSFGAALNGPSSSQFLQVLIQPGATGDLTTVDIFQDLNASGSLGPPTTLGVPVSGVCANGFISCQPGTWNNCQPYQWSAANTGQIAFTPVGITSLGGCYCINSSCNVGGQSLTFANSSIILNTLGGGIVAAIQNSVAGVMISSVLTDTVTITYTGQLTQQAQNAGGQSTSLQSSTTTSQAESYYSNPVQLASDTNCIGMTQGNNPTSLYSQVANSVANNQTTSTCNMAYTGKMNDTQQSVSDTGQTNGICVDNNTYIQIVSPDSLHYTFEFAGTGPGGLSQMGHNCGGLGWVPLTTATLPSLSSTTNWKLTSAAFTANISGGGCSSASASIDALVNGVGTIMQTNAICGASGAQSVNISWSSLLQYTLETYQETYQDGCTSYEPGGSNAGNCTLQSETTDGVVTVQNGNQTGLNPLSTCQTFPSEVGQPVQVCKPWWSKTRTYICTAPSYNFSSTTQRFQTVGSTTAENGTTVTYNDYSQNSTTGQWGTSTSSFTMTGTLGADCEQACQVQRTENNTQVGTDEVLSSNQIAGTASQNTYILTCQNGSCPVLAGDLVLQNCTCINDFGQAASIIQSMRLAGSDTICSSGTPQPPGTTSTTSSSGTSSP